MIEAKKNKEKVSISEEDISLILQRYTATTILALLKEVAQFSGVKIDWNVLVKKTSTGISNAREYQMLWRHLAYRDTLLGKVEDGIEPLDDDSDLETELEPSPAVNSEASTEAAACVKVLIASGLPSESCPANRATVEAPLTINIPNGQSSRIPFDNRQQARSAQGTNITIPVSVQKQPLPSVPSLEGLIGNGSASGNLPPRRKRKLWTTEEDMELIAAVQKCGEGNWANILKGDFKHDRTASQLSQRWAIIRKRKANLITSSASNLTGGALTEAQLAARQAVSLALNMPMKGSLSATPSVAAAGNSSTAPFTTSDASPVSAPAPEASTKAPVTSSLQTLHSQQAPNQAISSKAASTSNPALSKSRPTAKRSLAPAKNPPTGPNPLIQAAAVAAGARIANPSTAASLFKAAQSRNVVHIRQGGSVPQSSMPGARPMSTNTIVSLPPNVHFIRTGLTSHSHTYSGSTMPSGSRPSSEGSGRLATVGQPPSMGFSTLSGQQVVPESKSSSLTCGNSDSKRIPNVSTGAADISTASEDKHSGKEKLDGTEEVVTDSAGDQASLMNSKVDGNHIVVDGDGGNINSVRRQTNAKNLSPDESSSAVDKSMSSTDMEVDDKKVVDNNSNGQNENALAKPSSSPNMEVCEDQIVISKATENQEKLEVLPIAGVGENLRTANAGLENQNVIDEQICLPDLGFGGNQSGHDTAVIEKQTGLPNMESS